MGQHFNLITTMMLSLCLSLSITHTHVRAGSHARTHAHTQVKDQRGGLLRTRQICVRVRRPDTHALGGGRVEGDDASHIPGASQLWSWVAPSGVVRAPARGGMRPRLGDPLSSSASTHPRQLGPTPSPAPLTERLSWLVASGLESSANPPRASLSASFSALRG